MKDITMDFFDLLDEFDPVLDVNRDAELIKTQKENPIFQVWDEFLAIDYFKN